MTTALKVKTSSLPGSRLALEVGVPAGRCKASYEAVSYTHLTLPTKA